MNFDLPLYMNLKTDDNELELVASKGKSATYKFIKSNTNLDKLVSFKEEDLWNLIMLNTTICDYTPRKKKAVVEKQVKQKIVEPEQVFEKKVILKTSISKKQAKASQTKLF